MGLGHRTGDVHKGEGRYGDCFNVLVFMKGDYVSEFISRMGSSCQSRDPP